MLAAKIVSQVFDPEEPVLVTPRPKPEIRNLKPDTQDSKPETRNPKLETLSLKTCTACSTLKSRTLIPCTFLFGDKIESVPLS